MDGFIGTKQGVDLDAIECPFVEVAFFTVRDIRDFLERTLTAGVNITDASLRDRDQVITPQSGGQRLCGLHGHQLLVDRRSFEQAYGNDTGLISTQGVHALTVRANGHDVFIAVTGDGDTLLSVCGARAEVDGATGAGNRGLYVEKGISLHLSAS